MINPFTHWCDIVLGGGGIFSKDDEKTSPGHSQQNSSSKEEKNGGQSFQIKPSKQRAKKKKVPSCVVLWSSTSTSTVFFLFFFYTADMYYTVCKTILRQWHGRNIWSSRVGDTHIWAKYEGRKKNRFLRGSNPRPSACKADVITTTPRNQYVERDEFLRLYSGAHGRRTRENNQSRKFLNNDVMNSWRTHTSKLARFLVCGDLWTV